MSSQILTSEVAIIPFCGNADFVFHADIVRDAEGYVDLKLSCATAKTRSLKDFDWGYLSYKIIQGIDISPEGVILSSDSEEDPWIPLSLPLASWLRYLRFSNEEFDSKVAIALQRLASCQPGLHGLFEYSFGFAALFPGLDLKKRQESDRAALREPCKKSKPAKPKERKPRQARGFVYLIGCPATNSVKIGFSVNPNERLLNLQTASATPLSLLAKKPGTQRDEQAMHRKFSSLRKSGEWFEWSEDIVNSFSCS